MTHQQPAQEAVRITIPGRPVPMRYNLVPIGNRRSTIVPTMKVKKWQKDAIPFINQGFDGHQQINEAVVTECLWFFAPPKSWPKWKKQDALAGKVRPISKGREGDADSLEKALNDALVHSGHLKDDSLIVSVFKAKYYGQEERTEVKIEVVG